MIQQKRILCKGVLDKTLKDKYVILKQITDDDILEIKNILCGEIKRQKEEINQTGG